MKYFAYGMNTNLASMAQRCPAAQSLGRAVLENYRLVFKGCASIEPDFSHDMQGVLWEITPACEQALDRLEGYPHLYYKVHVMAVHNDEYVPCMAYVMPPDIALNYPSQHYLSTLEQGYADHGLHLQQLDLALEQIDMQPPTIEPWQKQHRHHVKHKHHTVRY